MDPLRSLPATMEDAAGIPEDLRCKRSDGKQWRCNALSMPDKTVCEKHYIQAKKRAANSAMRASLKKARRGSIDAPRSASPAGGDVLIPAKKYREGFASPEKVGRRGSLSRGDGSIDEENRGRHGFSRSPLSRGVKRFAGTGHGECFGRSSDSSGEAEGITCHQCRRTDRVNVVWCSSCARRGYCDSCISRWYAEIPAEEIRRSCPACRNICSCRVCLRGDNLIKIKVQEMPSLDKLRYLHRLLSFVLPVLKQIYSEQCFELGLEARVSDIKTDILRAKISADEQVCCDFCRIPIFDYHRHCTSCSYDLCLPCCRDLRQSSPVAVQTESVQHVVADSIRDIAYSAMTSESSDKMIEGKSVTRLVDVNAIDISQLHPEWKANSDGSIPCGPVEAGGCGSSNLVLRRILKINWVAQLVKNAEEMVNGCKIMEQDSFGECPCTKTATSQSSESREWRYSECSYTNGIKHKFLFKSSAQELKGEGIGHFQKHWFKGEPIVIKNALDPSLASKWDPSSIWKGIQELEDIRIKEEDLLVKAIDFLSQLEVSIELSEFIKGYTYGRKHEDGSLEMLKLKDWPPPNALEEFLLCHRPEFLSSLPLLEFIHSKWGVLNLAAKLPYYGVQTELGPKMLIGYGMHEECGRGDVVTNLQINMSDVVYLLMHSSEMNIQGWQRPSNDTSGRSSKQPESKEALGCVQLVNSGSKLNESTNSADGASKLHKNLREYGAMLNSREKVMEHLGQVGTETVFVGKKGLDSSTSKDYKRNVTGKIHAGAAWDVFHRQDVPKLYEYLRVHRQELRSSATQPVLHPIYDQAFFLNKDHKRRLKEEFGIEPWTFEQQVGEAVFIPAGCSFQVRNLQSSVQLALDFLSPESLGESVRLAQEIRCLPNDHDAKLKMLEVGKISLYAASSAIREIQKITLDPELNQDLKFEDQNLTSMVSENLERITKRRQILCP